MNRWTPEEELKLLTDISAGKKFSDLAPIYNRSDSALELRLKKIIYENIQFGKKSINSLHKSTNIPESTINQYFYSYKDYLEKQQKIKEKKGEDVKTVVDNVVNIINSANYPTDQTAQNNIHKGGSSNKLDSLLHISKLDKKIDKLATKLEKENKLLGAIVENKMLKNQINKLNKKNELDDDMKKIIKKMARKK